jgi:hypothetical protein
VRTRCGAVDDELAESLETTAVTSIQELVVHDAILPRGATARRTGARRAPYLRS